MIHHSCHHSCDSGRYTVYPLIGLVCSGPHTKGPAELVAARFCVEANRSSRLKNDVQSVNSCHRPDLSASLLIAQCSEPPSKRIEYLVSFQTVITEQENLGSSSVPIWSTPTTNSRSRLTIKRASPSSSNQTTKSTPCLPQTPKS